jgi:hypothetical protein
MQLRWYRRDFQCADDEGPSTAGSSEQTAPVSVSDLPVLEHRTPPRVAFLLETFCERNIYRYAKRRDYPARDCCSWVSAQFKHGTIGTREDRERAEPPKRSADNDEEHESVEEFQDQLAWREYN